LGARFCYTAGASACACAKNIKRRPRIKRPRGLLLCIAANLDRPMSQMGHQLQRRLS
jgi:hypothetical protein